MQTANINSPLTCWQPQQRKLLSEDDMQTIPVYQVDSFKVVHGANLSDTMSFADDIGAGQTLGEWQRRQSPE